MKNFSIVFTALLLAVSLSSFSQPGQWSYIGPDPFYLGGTDDWFGDITFVDSLNGYATDGINPRIMKTVDGGATWQMKQATLSGYLMQFANTQTGWISDGNTISKTTDGANTWINQFDTTQINHSSGYFGGLQFLDSLTGFVSGSYYIGKTTDGGNTWINISPLNIDSLWKKIYFLNADTGWAFSNDSAVARTFDGGQTWTAQKIPGIISYLGVSGAHFYSALVGVAITEMGNVYKTFDGGNNWSELPPPEMYGDFPNIKFGANGLVYGLDNNYDIYLSTDSCNTWDTLVPPECWAAVFFLNPSTGYTGFNHIYKTTDGGLTWNSDISQYAGNYQIADIGWESATHVIATTSPSFIESFDNGINWIQNDDELNHPLTIQNVSPDCYFMRWIDTGVQRYQNGIETYSNPNVSFVYAQSADSFIVWGSNLNSDTSLLMTTVDGGNTWSTVFVLPPLPAYSSGEWWDLSTGEGGLSSTYARFVNWDTGVVAYLDQSHTSHEFLTLNGGQSWTTYPPDSTDFIASTKLSPTGELFCLRTAGFFKYSLWKLDSVEQWQFISFINESLMPFIPGVEPDIDWSYDSILWSCTSPNGTDDFFSYSFDDGNTWNTYPLFINAPTMFKRVPGGKFICGTSEGELLIYDGTQYNCRLKGNVFYDFNRNGIFDGYDVEANAFPVNVTPGGLTAFTGYDGNYITAMDSGTYTVFPDTIGNYTSAPAYTNVAFTSQSDVISGVNFALQPIDTSIRDLILCIDEGFQSAPGYPHSTYISYTNVGVQPIQPTLVFIMDSALSFLNATPNITSQSGDTLFWNLPVIYPFQNNFIGLNTTLSADAQLLQTVTNIGVIYPLNTDNTPFNNIDTSVFYVLGSYDPNSKTAKPAVVSFNQTTQQTQIEYTINFQNTGSAAAKVVVVKDQLDASLNPATLKIIGSSFPCTYSLQPGNVAVFTFSNIQLPDSTADKVNSHGFINYIISPKAGEIAAASINNTADIYFDYNPAVSTNNAQVTVTSTMTDIKPVYGDRSINIKIFPNPSSSDVHVESSGDFTAKLFDMWGQPIFANKSSHSRLDFSVSELPSGVYTLQVQEDGIMRGYSLCVISH